MSEKIADILKKQLGASMSIESDASTIPASLTIDASHVESVCQELYSNEQLYFDMLSCITGVDNGEEAGTMEVIYNLYSIPNEQSLMLKVVLERKKEGEELPAIGSVASIWKTADWQEREIFDLLGINFINHPDLRRILMPADWEGHPLRKDYKEQEKYRGMSVEYDRDEDGNEEGQE